MKKIVSFETAKKLEVAGLKHKFTNANAAEAVAEAFLSQTKLKKTL